MKRVSIIGSGGAGKSTLARQMGDVLGLPVIHLDQLYWNPNWTETPKDEWLRQVEELVSGERWIIDGNFGGTMEIRLAASDTVVYLDYSRYICLWRSGKRWLIHWNRTRPDMGEGCPEKIDLAFLRWIWNFRKVTKPKIEERLAQLTESHKLIRLTSPSETKAFLSELRNGTG